jgi:hypothetical protein
LRDYRSAFTGEHDECKTAISFNLVFNDTDDKEIDLTKLIDAEYKTTIDRDGADHGSATLQRM